MTLEEVAAYLRLKPQTIYTWAQEKKIPAAKLGKEWRFKKSIVDEWFVRHIDEKFSDLLGTGKRSEKLMEVVDRIGCAEARLRWLVNVASYTVFHWQRGSVVCPVLAVDERR